MTNTLKDKEKEIETYRNQRIKDFVFLMRNLEEVHHAIPCDMTNILKKKLEKELREFLRERRNYENTI